MDDKHLDTRQLAARWAMAPSTLANQRALREGCPFLKLGGHVVYRLADVEAFEASRLVATS